MRVCQLLFSLTHGNAQNYERSTADGYCQLGAKSAQLAQGTVRLTADVTKLYGISRSEASNEARHLGPGRKGHGSGLAMISGGVVSGTAEKVCNLIVNREEALRLSGRFEALHDALSPSGGLVAVLGAVIQALVLPMLHARHHRPLGRSTAGELIGN